ncbi:hypothetical protein IQ07DRAFT_368806 [Pyrenochaeta sp. DS3sAY3a]|nr:hypothetical protein IQ07DRAFT_368806 [Pyrenochaeta sp. DS3sAY3a]
MSMSKLPKEIRLQIWTLAYFSQAPRLVAIETHQHDEFHSKDTFCPRYSPTPAPTVFNICQESRAEAHFQALKAGHVVRLPYAASPDFFSDFYFRWDVDILFLSTTGPRVGHLDDSFEVGLLAHFREASAGTPTATALRNVSITDPDWTSYRYGGLSDFPNIARVIMMVDRGCLDGDVLQRTRAVGAAKRTVLMYRYALTMEAKKRGVEYKAPPFVLDFAILGTAGELQIIPREEWREWGNTGDEWATLEMGMGWFQ